MSREAQQRKRHVARLMARHRAAVTLQIRWRYCLWQRAFRLKRKEAEQAKARATAQMLARPRPSASSTTIVSPRLARPAARQPATPTGSGAASRTADAAPLENKSLAERLAQASPARKTALSPARKTALSPFRALAGSSKWRSASSALPSQPLPEGVPLEAARPSTDGPAAAAAPDSLEAKRALLLKIRSQRKRLETQLLTQSGAGALQAAVAAAESQQAQQSEAGQTASFGGFARLVARRNSNCGARAGSDETATEREQTRVTRFNTLHNSHSITNFDLPGPDDFEAQERHLAMVRWKRAWGGGGRGREERSSALYVRLPQSPRSSLPLPLSLSFPSSPPMPPRPFSYTSSTPLACQVDAKQGTVESPAAPRPTTRLQWKAELCRDVPVSPQKEPRAAPTILRRRPAEHVFPFANSLHPQRVVVLPKVRGARRGSSQLESPMAVGELLANNRAAATPL